MAEALLTVQGLASGYGEAQVLSDISFEVGAGCSLALLGRNGTGKTTLIDTLAASRWPAGRCRSCPRMSGRLPAWAGCRRSATSSSR
jgi:ABC-type branched-subunit amino acid transport system ATPase component